MKKLLHFVFFAVSFRGFAQVHPSMPPEANDFYNKAMVTIKPALKNLVEINSNKFKNRTVNADSLINELKKNELLKDLNENDIEAITVLIMVQASKNADADLKNLVIKTRSATDQNPGIKYESAQQILEQKSRITATIPVVMKRISASGESTINNLK